MSRRPISGITREDVREGVDHLIQLGLSREVDVVELDPRQIAVSQDVDQKQVDRIAQSIRFQGGWPEDLPLIVVGRIGDTYEVVDGNHRGAAAIQAGMDKIPTLAVDLEAAESLWAVLGLNSVLEVFAAKSPEMDHNQDLRWLSEGEL